MGSQRTEHRWVTFTFTINYCLEFSLPLTMQHLVFFLVIIWWEKFDQFWSLMRPQLSRTRIHVHREQRHFLEGATAAPWAYSGSSIRQKQKDALEARCLLPDNPMDTQFRRRMEAPKGADLPQSLSHLHQEGDSENRISSVKDTFKYPHFLSFDN